MANLEEIARRPRMQGMSFGPADLAASRRMKTTRVGGGHPGYRVISDRTVGTSAPRESAQQDLWHYSIGRMVDACAAAGILPFYGPFGDIKDVVGCETQFRAAFLMGCVGAWSLHPVQIDIAKKVFSPDPEEVAFAKKVIEAIPDGRGVHMIDGKMQDDATWKQCRVMVDLAEMLAAKDPELAEAYGLESRLTAEHVAPRRPRSSPRPAAWRARLRRRRRRLVHRRPRGRRPRGDAAVGGAREFVFDLGGVRRYETEALVELSALCRRLVSLRSEAIVAAHDPVLLELRGSHTATADDRADARLGALRLLSRRRLDCSASSGSPGSGAHARVVREAARVAEAPAPGPRDPHQRGRRGSAPCGSCRRGERAASWRARPAAPAAGLPGRRRQRRRR